jgi:addiction module HigA family antidote
LRVPATRVGAILKQQRAVSADTALRLSRYFGTSPEFWLALQSRYDLTKALADLAPKIEREVKPRAA